jgi:hypothetical protein
MKEMIVPNQLIEVKWGSKNKQWYEEKGYLYTGIGTKLLVKAEDLTIGININVIYQCDNKNCNKKFLIKYRSAYNALKKQGIVFCEECMYKRISENKIKKHKNTEYNFNEVEMYKKILKGEIKRFPDGYIVNMTINQAKNIINYLIDYLLSNKIVKNKKYIPKFLTQKTFRKYKLSRLVDNFGINNLLNEVFDGSVNQWEYAMVEDGFWDNDENVRKVLFWFFDKLIEDGTIKSIDDLPKMSYKEKLIEYNISSITKRFNNSFSKLCTYIDPERFKIWFFSLPKNYLKDDNNIREMMNWFISKLLEDGVVKNIDEIPHISTRELYIKYKLDSMLANRFHYSPFQALDFMYPNRWNQWEFYHVTNNYWDDPNNVRIALIWFVDQMKKDNIITNLEDLNNININKCLIKYKLATLNLKYDIPFMLTMIYGNKINYHNYKNRISDIDDTKLDSIEEKQIHDLIIKNIKNVNKPKKSNDYKFVNKKHNEGYIPDWIINENLIVEYFGLYVDKPVNDYQEGYKNKTIRKIEYYNTLENYKFIPLFPKDLKNNYIGIINKFKNYEINLVV